MPVTYEWDNPEHTILRYVVTPEWTWPQMHSVIDQARGAIEAEDHLVDIVVDYHQGSSVPPDTIANMRHLAGHRPVHGGIVVIVSEGPLLRGMYEVFSRVYHALHLRLGTQFVVSLDEARALICEHRARQVSE